LRRSLKDFVEDGRLTLEEFGFLCASALEINPHNGFWLTNFTEISIRFCIDQDKARYLAA